jgi:CubicO group peptidase (beta-lactamase class C family)
MIRSRRVQPWLVASVISLAAIAAGRAAPHQPATASTTAVQVAGVPFPPAGTWPAKDPAILGFDRAKLDAAIAFAVANENQNTKDLTVDILNSFRAEAPYNALIGPTAPRTGSNGVVIRRGAVAASWGDAARADMTFSVTKTFLTTLVGVLYDRGRITNVTDRVAPYMPPGVDLFTLPHNAPITWEHLLRQTSDWSGELWGKPDWADRPPSGQTPAQWPNRALHEPGTFYKYNDTRVNVLALAALYLAKQPLPDLLRSAVMDPIGASNSWRWEAYDNAWVTIDGTRMKSVTGGGHFGGGLFINSWDLARFGYLFLRNGRWHDSQIISEKWMGMARSPGPANPGYGFANWFLNLDGKSMPSTPTSSVTFQGNGQNIVYVDWEHDLVVVVRWLGGGTRTVDRFLGQVLAAINP